MKKISNSLKLKDSGNRRVFSSGAVRDRSLGKGNFALLSPISNTKLAEHFEKGALKYESRNWEKGMEISNFIDSALRHLSQYIEGKRDEPHLVSALWNLHAAVHGQEMVERGLWPIEYFDLPCYINEKDMDPETKQWWSDMKKIIAKSKTAKPQK